MHIPDGYLSPETAVVMYAASVPFWWRASQQVKKLLRGRSVPLIGLFAAFSFVIMMFNVPLPGGTTGHAVGATITAIVVGPWAAVLTTTVALVIQALFFGDGGILAIGANVFNMGIAMPFVAYYLYRALSGRAPAVSARRVIAAAVAGYVAINVSAFLTGFELGIQPLLFRGASGLALYFPYPVEVALPAMMLGHLTIAGAAEAALTAFVLAWLQRSNPQLLEAATANEAGGDAGVRWAWLGLIGLVLLTPMGLLAPGTAWGEWGREELVQLGLGYIPAGFDRFAGLWAAPIPGYDIPLLNNPTVAYVLSAVVGVVVVLAVIWFIGWLYERTTRGGAPGASTAAGAK